MRSAFITTGAVLFIMSILMLIPAVVSIIYHENHYTFITSAIITAIVSIFLIVIGKSQRLSSSEVVIITSISWVIATIFSSIPFCMSGLSYADAFFEAMSGITTTGSTILTNVSAQDKSILMWRAVLHGIGGIGVIVSTIAVLPIFKGVNNVQLFHAESSENSGNTLGNINQISLSITLVYLLLILVCGVLYFFAGMGLFDAICHSLSTVSTGGFSNYDISFTHYSEPIISYIAIIFMILGALPFVLLIKLFRGNLSIIKDEQVKFLLISIVIFAIPVAIDASDTLSNDNTVFDSIRLALFNITSIITSTGFIDENYNLWGIGVTNVILFFIAFIGGCSGSTAGGIKIFRIIILCKHSFYNIKHILNPYKIETISINGNQLTHGTISYAYSFFFIFINLYLLSAVLLSCLGADFITSLSAASAAITNSGPGLGGVVGPYGNYSSLTDPSKFLLSFMMIVGRLEVFTVMAFIILVLRGKQ